MKSGDQYKKYLKGEMTEELMDEYTSKIVKTHFKEEKLKKKWSDIVDSKYDLSHLKNESTKVKKSRQKIIVAVMSIAASLLIVYMIANSFLQKKAPDSSLLVQQYLEEPFPFAGVRKGPQSISALRTVAADAYGGKDYKMSIDALNKIIASPEVKSSDFFYLGLCHLYSNEPNKAILYIEKSKKKDDEFFEKEGKWFLALAYFQNNDLENSKSHLEEIAKWKQAPNARVWEVTKSEEAEALLKSLE